MNDPNEYEEIMALSPRRCCICDQMKNPCRTLAMLSVKGPEGGKGWGCFVCGLPMEGAIAVVCDDCADAGKSYEDIRFVCDGNIDAAGRIPIADLTTPHLHNPRFHPEMEEGN